MIVRFPYNIHVSGSESQLILYAGMVLRSEGSSHAVRRNQATYHTAALSYLRC